MSYNLFLLENVDHTVGEIFKTIAKLKLKSMYSNLNILLIVIQT